MTAKWWKIIGGCVAIILWGLFFDDLARVGRWIFDSTYVSIYHVPLADLVFRYHDADLALTHGNLYKVGIQTYTYPPVTAYLFVPFRPIGLRDTMTVWTVGNMVALAVIFAVSLRRWFNVSIADAWFASAVGLAPGAVFAFYPIRSLLLWGQLGILLMLLVFVDLFVVPTKYRGFLIGAAVAIKLMPVIFVAWLIAKREIRSVLQAAIGFGTLTLLAAAAWPSASAKYWFHILPSLRVGDVQQDVGWAEGIGRLPDQSMRGLLARPPFLWSGTFPWIIVALGILVLGIAAMTKLLKQERGLAAFVLLSVVTELASPVSWPHYWVFVVLVPLLAVLEWKRDRPLAIASIVMALSTCVNVDDPNLNAAPLCPWPRPNCLS